MKVKAIRGQHTTDADKDAAEKRLREAARKPAAPPPPAAPPEKASRTGRHYPPNGSVQARRHGTIGTERAQQGQIHGVWASHDVGNLMNTIGAIAAQGRFAGDPHRLEVNVATNARIGTNALNQAALNKARIVARPDKDPLTGYPF